MFKSLSDRIEELESAYNSWLREYARNVLTKISNNNYICLVSDLIMSDIKYVVIEDDIVEDTFNELGKTGKDSNFKYLYHNLNTIGDVYNHGHPDDVYSDPVKYDIANKSISLRKIFGDGNLTNIDKVLKYIISLKDTINSNSRLAIEYIDALYNNLINVSMFIDMKEYMYDDRFIENEIPRLLDINYNSYVRTKFYNINEDVEKSESIKSTFMSNEADDEQKQLDDAKKDRENIKNIDKTILKVKNIIDEGRLNVKHFFDKFNIARNMFYQKNLGKIEHLYEHYSNDAMIVENELKGDPVQILMNEAGKYLANLIDGIVYTYHLYNNHMNKLFSCKSYPEMIVEINKYLTLNDVKLKIESKPNEVKQALVKDLRFKIANIILENNKVYGYTVESITNQKYPPIDHVMISLFMEKPHEKPVEQSVSSIFSSADSFKLMGKEFKMIVLESSKIVINKMKTISIKDDFKKMTMHLDGYVRQNKINLTTNKVDGMGDGKNDLNKRISILKDHRSIFESFIPLMIYASEAGIAMYTISTRIDRTCRDALKALLLVEREKSDPNYKHDTSSSKKYQTSQTKLQKIQEKNEKTREINESNRQARNEINGLRKYQPHSDTTKIKYNF